MKRNQIWQKSGYLTRYEVLSVKLRTVGAFVLAGGLTILGGCTSEALSGSHLRPESISETLAVTPADQNSVRRSGEGDAISRETTKTDQPFRDTSTNPSQEKKETRTMWFTGGKNTIEHANAANFNTLVAQSSVPVLVDFYADWCGPCRALAPILEQLAQEVNGVRIVKVNVDQAPTLAAQYRVSAIPTLILFDQGRPVQRITGLASKEDLKRLLALD
ncbi:MAG TPA: thioredoxin [Thermogutta sp.]|nr:thioredoxin [Thermogutta sp.]HOP77269.1 thioredoxin [Thermogutta sp.]HPU05208.1 thioredoxin [Thermogutta sp.]HQF13070.1 thioredoxin [Thermogutta sp.]